MTFDRRSLLLGLAAVSLLPKPVFASTVRTQDITLTTASGRAVTVRLVAPARRRQRLGLLLFSHGANSSPAKYDRLTQAWAAAGYVVAGALHPDSTDHPSKGSTPRPLVWRQRIEDMRLMLDSLRAIERTLDQRLDAKRIAATGHSYGALVAQALGGAEVLDLETKAPTQAFDPRVKAVIAFSPPGPLPGFITAEGWAKMRVPQFVQTGTLDILPMIAPQWQAHLASFEAASVMPSVAVVGEGVDHYFGNIIGRPELTIAPQTAGFDASVDLSLRFLAAVMAGKPLDLGGAKARHTPALYDVMVKGAKP
jgi:predicted dienelactone hydrolase